MSERTAVLPCFRCGRIPEQDHGVMTGAAPFTSRGNYGSVYNPMMARDVFLRINICDKCLQWGAEKNHILEAHVLNRPAPDISFAYWDPESSFLGIAG